MPPLVKLNKIISYQDRPDIECETRDGDTFHGCRIVKWQRFKVTRKYAGRILVSEKYEEIDVEERIPKHPFCMKIKCEE